MKLTLCVTTVMLHTIIYTSVIGCKHQTFNDTIVRAFYTNIVLARFRVNGCIEKTETTKNIRSLYIQEPVPVILDGAIQNLDKLRSLSIIWREVAEIQSGAFINLTVLEELILDKNEIREIKQENFFQNLPIRFLSLENNNISHVEPGSFTNTKLKMLRLSGNKLNEFTPEWFVESNLEEIYVDNNLLEYIPGNAFQDLKQLTSISFSENDIRNIHKGTFGNTTLQKLHIDHNALYLFSPDWFHESNIEELNLSYNYINYIPKEAFKNLNKLTILNFAYNEITNLHENAFTNAEKLYSIDLRNNVIKTLPDKLFSPEYAYHSIYLHANYLTFLSQQFLDNLNTKYLTIHTNPWQCACYFIITDRLKAKCISLFAKNRGCTSYKNPVCVTPVNNGSLCMEETHKENYPEFYKNFNFKLCKDRFHFQQLIKDGYVSCMEKRNEFCYIYERVL